MFIVMAGDADYYEPVAKAVKDSTEGYFLIMPPISQDTDIVLHQGQRIRRILKHNIPSSKKNKEFEKICSLIPTGIEEPYYFIFTMFWVEYIHAGLVEYIKKHFPKSVSVLYLLDISNHYRKALDNIYFKKIFDRIITFDFRDANKFGYYLYENAIYSKIDFVSNDALEKSDIYFCGAAKNRLTNILNAFSFFKENGLHCDFHITNVLDCEQKWRDEIHYNQTISYRENLQRIERTNCILEVMQMGGSGYTLRTREALFMDKKLITNNEYILRANFYDASRFCVYHDIDTLNLDFLVETPQPISPTIIEQMSANSFFKYIRGILTEK